MYFVCMYNIEPCEGNDEYLNPGPNCDTECATLNEPCTKVYFRAPDGCYCNKGYARDNDNHCVPIEQC